MNITSNGNTDLTTIPGRSYAFSANGTFGSGTLAVQWVNDTVATTFSDNDGDVELTAAGARVIVAPSRTVRFALTGATNPNINAHLVLIP